MEAVNFKHSGNIGDVWAAIPAMKEFYKKTGKKVNLYLTNGQTAIYYEGATHPTKNANGDHVMLNSAMIDMMLPLLKEQDCFNIVKEHEGEPIFCDLDAIRESYVGMPSFSINRWYFYVYPDLACNTSTKWLHIPDTDVDLAKNKIIITRTERYTNETLDYSFLKDYEDDCIFSGTMKEYNYFCMTFDLQIKKLKVNNFLELAQAIKQSRFHISNQTMAYQLSQGIEKPSILELCHFAPNCIEHGEDCYDLFHQMGLEYYFKLLHEKTAQ